MENRVPTDILLYDKSWVESPSEDVRSAEDDVHGVSRLAAHDVEVVGVGAVRVGDRISEVGSPGGPWYPVLLVDERSLTIDGRMTAEEPELPVTLEYCATAQVLRRLP